MVQHVGRDAAFAHVGFGDAEFAGDDGDDLRAAEARLAPAHAGPDAPLHGVQRLRSDRAVYRLDDFRLGDQLAAADDLPVARVLRDKGVFLSVGLVAEEAEVSVTRRPSFRNEPRWMWRVRSGVRRIGSLTPFADVGEAVAVGV